MRKRACNSLPGVLLLSAVLLTSCFTPPTPEEETPKRKEPPPPPKTIFTPAMFDKIPEDSLDKIQFYLSNRITLTESNPGAMSVDSGVIIITEDSIFKEVTVPVETPGVLRSYELRDGLIALKVGFDEDPQYELLFVGNRERERFEIMIVIEDGLPKTTYGDTNYEISYQGPGIPHLLVVTEERTSKHQGAIIVKGRYIMDKEEEAPSPEKSGRTLPGSGD